MLFREYKLCYIDHMSKRRGRGCLITIIVVALLAAAVWFIGLPLVDKKAEGLVDSAIQDMVRSGGLEGLSYERLRIDAARGYVQIDGLSVPMDGATVRVGSISLTVDPKELAAFGLGRSEGLSSAELGIEDLVYSGEAMSVDLRSAQIMVDGLIDLNSPERSTVRDLSIDASEVRYSDKESGLGLDTKRLELQISGRMRAATVEKDFEGILDDIAYVDLDAKEGTIVPDAQIMEQVALFASVSPWIADTKNWSFASVEMEARSLENSLALDSFALVAPLMDAKGTASIPRKNAKDVALQLEVEQLNSQVRDELNPLLGMIGQTIPADSFDLTFAWQGMGIPHMVFD